MNALLAGDPSRAARAFDAALAADPAFALAHAGLALAQAELGDQDGAAAALGRAQERQRLSRRDRHQITVVALVLTGQRPRASALGCEHLEEFPDDDLVRHALARCAAGHP